MKKIISVIMAVITTALMFTGCTPKLEKYSTMMIGPFDTVISVISYQPSQEAFDEMAQLIGDNYVYLNKLYDIYNDYEGINNIKTINDNAGIKPVEVEQEIIDLLNFSKEWHEKSNGKMNVAMGSVLRVWHDVREEYDAKRENLKDGEEIEIELPDIELLKEKAKHTDINCIEIDDENNTVFITDPEVQLDVGAVAKGFATEIICDKLNEKYDNYAISAGGNVKTHGHPQDGRQRWGIGIENPAVDENFQKIPGNIDMAYFNTDMSLVCSGGYQRFMVIDGKRYHHIVDPVTLYPEEVYQGVSILCEDSGVADALSTSVFLMKPDEAMEFINGIDNAECILVEIDGTVHISEGADAYLGSAGVDSNTK